MNHLKTIAIFMICLILTLPFYSANVFAAANVMSAKTYGGSGVERYRKSIDSTRFEAVVGGEPVGAEYVYLESFSGGFKQQFTSCVDADFGYNCVKTLEIDTLTGGLYTYYIRSYDNPNGQGTAASTMITDIIVDDIKPIVNTFTSNFNNVGLDQEVRLNFDISDVAAQGCSGFGRVELSVGTENNVIDTLPLNEVVGCSYFSNLTVVPGQHIAEGATKVMYYLKVYDRFDNPSDAKYLQVKVDSEAPSIVESSFEIVTQIGDEPVYYVKKGESTPVVINFLVDGDVDSVNADLLDINSNYISLVSGSCQQIGYERYRCNWNAFINVGETTNAQIKSRAYDDSGNFDEAVFPYTVFVDDSPPELSSLTTGLSHDGVMYVGKKTTYNALITESGVGLNLSKVYLDLSEINGRSNVKADNCTGAGATWNCYWYDIETTNGEGHKQLKLIGEDDSGNAFGKLGIVVYADTTFPEIVSTNYTSSSGYCPTTADMITFEVGVIEASPGLELSVDVSDISTGAENVDGSCSLISDEEGEESGDEWECTAVVGEIISGHFDGDVGFILTDGSNNTIEDVIELEVCLLDNVTVEPNFFDLLEDPPEAVPSIVSRKGLSKYNYPVFVFPRLVASGLTDILNFETSCVGAEVIDVLGERSTNPTLSLRLDQDDNTSDIEEISINCSFSIKLRSGNTVYLNPEIEEFEVPFTLYDTSFGDVTDAMEDKIYGVKERLTELNSSISTLNTVNNIFRVITVITTTLVKVAITAATLLPVIYGVAWILYGVCAIPVVPCEPTSAANAVWMPVGNVLHYIFLGIERFVWPLGIANIGSLWRILFKTIVMLHSCKLCDLNNVASVVSNIGSGTHTVSSDIPWGWSTDRDPRNDLFGNKYVGTIFYDWDPYRSIHTASSCLCIPGYIYNLRKEKAINCRQLRCLEGSVEKGYPSAMCDEKKTQEQCLYVDGAAWTVYGLSEGIWEWIGLFLTQLMGQLLQSLALLAAGIAWSFTCKPLLYPENTAPSVVPIPNIIDNSLIIGCELSGAAIMLVEIDGFGDYWDWDAYNTIVYGYNNPCEGLDYEIDDDGSDDSGSSEAEEALELDI
ncbi:hypothetical protein ISS04_02200 [Candidatus Woesearchaeota archaeon]|nr:hypothetical protein [Candidatus Woesearchaeota archaeon]